MESEKKTDIKRKVPQKHATGQLIPAVRRGKVSEVEELLAAGAKVWVRDKKGNTPLHWAARLGSEEAVHCLLAAGADVAAVDRWWRQTPLHGAAEWGHAAVAEVLLVAGADPDCRDGDGRTPLHLAAGGGHADVVAALLDAGADRGVRDDAGRMPADVVSRANRERLLDALRCCGVGSTGWHMDGKLRKIQWHALEYQCLVTLLPGRCLSALRKTPAAAVFRWT